MNIYRWEASGRVVEIMATSLDQARVKARGHLDHVAYSLTLTQPGTIRQCSKQALIGECVRSWTTH